MPQISTVSAKTYVNTLPSAANRKPTHNHGCGFTVAFQTIRNQITSLLRPHCGHSPQKNNGGHKNNHLINSTTKKFSSPIRTPNTPHLPLKINNNRNPLPSEELAGVHLFLHALKQFSQPPAQTPKTAPTALTALTASPFASIENKKNAAASDYWTDIEDFWQFEKLWEKINPAITTSQIGN